MFLQFAPAERLAFDAATWAVGDRDGQWRLRFEALPTMHHEEEIYVGSGKPVYVWWPQEESHVSGHLAKKWVSTCLPNLGHALESTMNSKYVLLSSNCEHGVCRVLASLYHRRMFSMGSLDATLNRGVRNTKTNIQNINPKVKSLKCLAQLVMPPQTGKAPQLTSRARTGKNNDFGPH